MRCSRPWVGRLASAVTVPHGTISCWSARSIAIAESWKPDRVRRHHVVIELIDVGKELVQHPHRRDGLAILDVDEDLLDQQVLVGPIKPTPEILDSNVPGADSPVVVPRAVDIVVAGHEVVEEERNETEERLRDGRKCGLLPVGHRLQQHPAAPVLDQPPEPPRKVGRERLLPPVTGRRRTCPRGGGQDLRNRRGHQAAHGLPGDLIGLHRLERHRLELGHEAVIHRVKENQETASLLERGSHIGVEQDVENIQVAFVTTGNIVSPIEVVDQTRQAHRDPTLPDVVDVET